MKFLCTLLLIASHSAIAQTTIAEARKMKPGKIVTIAGRVTAKEFGDLSFIQDHTGGIAVYGARYVPMHGDSVSITGELKKYNGMLEVVTDTIYVIKPGPGEVEPKTVDFPEDHEGELIRLTKVRIEPPGLFFYPQRAGMLITSRDTIQYWIDEDTDIAGYTIPPGPASITAVVGRFGDQIQLLPRSHEDIDNVFIDQHNTSNNFRILNWNLEFFGAPKYGPTNDKLQVENVAQVLNEINADIIALQEISNDDAFKDLIRSLPGYGGRCSNRYSYSFDTGNDFPPQKLCFVYNLSTVKVIREKVLFRKMFDEHPSDMFSGGRLPYLLEIEVKGHRLSLINYHGKSGDQVTDYNRRELDSWLLKDTLDLYYSTSEFILLGDFNDDLDVSIVRQAASPYRNFTNDENYECITKDLGLHGWHSTIEYDDVIDHQIISSELNDYFIDTRIINPFVTIPLYARTTSDHLPVISEFDMTKVITGVPNDNSSVVFPNPTTDEIRISSELHDIIIINSNGTIVYKTKGAHSPISLGEYAPGIYTLILDNQVIRLVKH